MSAIRIAFQISSDAATMSAAGLAANGCSTL